MTAGGLDERARAALVAATQGQAEIRFDEPMARHSTLRIGGPVDAWVAPRSVEALGAVRVAANRLGVPARAFGAGSNLLVRDGGIRGIAVSLKYLGRVALLAGDRENAEGANVLVEAGAATGRVLAFSLRQGLGGVEFLAGVPGTVGGGVIMNAGTYLGEFKDVTVRVFSVDEQGGLVSRGGAECGFAYRVSAIPAAEIVTHVHLRLEPRPRAEIQAAVDSLRQRRYAREPHGLPNAGSIFKNPPGDYAGRLIEACGLKGRRVGGAEISPAHANWIVNAGGATAADVVALVEVVRAEVQRAHGVLLELEIKVVGDEPQPRGKA